MRSAMYYPHTRINSPFLLRNSLLLWDEVHLIVPTEGFPISYDDNTDFGRAQHQAMTLIGKKRCPTKQEQTEAHSIIQAFVDHPRNPAGHAKLPDAFFYTEQKAAYDIYATKFLDDTWTLLRDAGLAGSEKRGEVSLDKMFGLSIMSILADCCAGETLARITDRGAAYAAVVELLRGQPEEPVKEPSDAYECLVPISLKVLNIDEIELSRLIALRQREASGEREISDLRHRYVDKLDIYAGKLAKVKSKGDRDEIQRQFETDMKDDVANLREALKYAKGELAFSKEIFSCVLGAAALIGAYAFGVTPETFGLALGLKGVIGPGGGAVTAIGGLSVNNKYKAARRSVLQKYPTAFLYEYL
jgi:hypothetical protein